MSVDKIINSLFSDNLNESNDAVKNVLKNKIDIRLEELKKDVASTLSEKSSSHYTNYIKAGLPSEPNLNPDAGYNSQVFHGIINPSNKTKQSKSTPKNVVHTHATHIHHEPEHFHKDDIDVSELENIVHEGKDIGKPNIGSDTGFKNLENKAAKEYGSKEAGARVAGAILKKILHKK